jgi:mannosyltransferase
VRVVPDAWLDASPEAGQHELVPRPAARSSALRTTIGLTIAAVVAAGLVFRFLTSSHLWSDEALSVNIANLHLSDLRVALRQDGAPPLYYVLLHVWMRLFGTGDWTVRAMSGLFSVATLPVAWAVGRRLDRRRLALGVPTEDRSTVAWAAVLLFASSPFAIRYATETRMYSLVMLLAALGYLAVLAALERPTLWRLAAITVVTGLLLYTHYWAFALVLVVAAFVAGAVIRDHSRRAALRVLVAIGIGCLTFVPWLPTFLYQERHTGTPWGVPVSPWKGTSTAVLDFGGSTRFLAWGLLVLVLLALFARARDGRYLDVDLWTRPGVRTELVVAFGTLWCGLVISYIGHSTFESRYAAVMFPMFLFAAAYGVTVFANRLVRYGVLAIAVVLGFTGGVSNVRTERTQAPQIASAILASARPGDVVAYCPDSNGPDVHRLIPGWRGLREVTYPDLAGPSRIDWIDYQARTRAVTAPEFANRLETFAGHSDIWFVWSSGLNGLKDKCERVLDDLSKTTGDHARVVEPNLGMFEHMGLVHYTLG